MILSLAPSVSSTRALRPAVTVYRPAPGTKAQNPGGAGGKPPPHSSALTLIQPALTLKAMKVDFTPDQEALIRQAIASGRYHTAEDAVHDAMARWEESERARIEMLAALDEAESDLEAGREATSASQK